MGCDFKKCRLFGYVIIPDHVHILLKPHGKYSISDYMHFAKRHSSRNINILMRNTVFPVGEDGHPRLRGGVEFPTHASGQTFARLREYVDSRNTTAKRFAWHGSYHDHIIRDQDDFNAYMEYLKYNPIKHGLIKEGELYPYLFLERNQSCC